MGDIRGWLSQAGFSDVSIDVGQRDSIADLFLNGRERCGIYILHFDDGEYYAGKSMDVVKRYAQHRLTFPDIVQFSFLPTHSDGLTTKEEETIKALEGLGEHLRNKQIVEFSYGDTALGQVLHTDDLLWWASDAENTFIDLERTDNVLQRNRYARELTHLEQLPYAAEAIAVARVFVQNTIPAPVGTEVKFWSVTRPSRSKRIYLRVNVGAQQTLEIGLSEDDLQPEYSLFLPQASVSGIFFGLDEFTGEGGVQFGDSDSPDSLVVWFGGQKAGGFREQVTIETQSADTMFDLLYDEGIICACRKFHVSLMQKGPCLGAKNHIYALADLLLEPPANDPAAEE